MLTTPEKILKRNASDMALSTINLIFTMEMVGLWIVGAFLTSILPGIVGGFIYFLWTIICLQVITGGIGRLVTLELTAQEPLIFSSTLAKVWNFIKSQFLNILLAPWILGLVFFLSFGAIIVAVFVLNKIPGIGSFLGSILIIPIFILVLAAIPLSLSIFFVDCVVGVEKCSFIQATTLLIKAVIKNPLKFIGGLFQALISILPMSLLSFVLTAFGLIVSLAICKGGTIFSALSSFRGLDVFNFIDKISMGFIVFAWLAYLLSFISCSFTLIYYNLSVADTSTQ